MDCVEGERGRGGAVMRDELCKVAWGLLSMSGRGGGWVVKATVPDFLGFVFQRVKK